MAFDPDAPYRLSPRVGLRPEPFGALAYHFDTRRLVFLKSNELVDVVNALGDHACATDAVNAVLAPTPARRSNYLAALASLLESGVIDAVHRDADSVSPDLEISA